MRHEMGGNPKNIGSIHSAFWNVERHIQHLFSLLELIDSTKVVTQLIGTQNDSKKYRPDYLPELYSQFVDSFLEQFTPSRTTLLERPRLAKWLQTIVPARNSISFLLNSISGCGKENVCFQHFIYNIS
jgi:hypothetical protein